VVGIVHRYAPELQESLARQSATATPFAAAGASGDLQRREL
jgi:hypothetical protein